MGVNSEGLSFGIVYPLEVVARHRLYSESIDYFIRPREDLLMILNALLGFSAPITL